ALFVGSQCAGKSTISLALAARGHDFLSDDTGCYDPMSHELVPYRRPVGIRSGPRSALIDAALSRNAHRSVIDDGALRVDIESLLPLKPERRLPLRTIVFLERFADRPHLQTIEPGRAEVGRLQAMYSSLQNASHQQRTFELVRMLSRSRVAYLHVGDPDDTASLLEEELGIR